MSNFSSNGISCFDGADITNDMSMLEVTGMHEQEAVQRMGIHPPRETVYMRQSGQPMLTWKKLSLPIMIEYSAETQHAFKKPQIECEALRHLYVKILGAKKNDRVSALLPSGCTLGSLIGSIYIEGARSTGYMDLIGCLTHPTIASDLSMPFLSTDGHAKRGNFYLPSGNQETPLFRIRKHEGASVSPSFLAQYGSAWSLQKLESVPLDSRNTHFLVPRRSPIVQLLHDFAEKKARIETKYDPEEPRHQGSQIEASYHRSLAEHRSSWFGMRENPLDRPDKGDISIPASLYQKALSKVRQDDESKLTLGNFLEHAKLFLFEAHSTDEPFSQNSPELKNQVVRKEEHYQRTNLVKLTITMFLGVLVEQKKE